MAQLLDSGTAALQSGNFYLEVLIVSTVLFFGAILIGFVVVVTVPRLLNLFITPDRVYRLYGFHYLVHRLIAALTNQKFFTELFGDSSYIVGYLRSIGYKLTAGRADGVELRHGGAAREPVPERGGWRDRGGRRAVAHQRRLLQHVLPGVAGVDRRATTSSATTSPTPRRAARATTACSATKVLVPIDGELREGVGPAGLAQLRDPADGRARQQPRRGGPRRAAPQPAPPRTGTTPSPSCCDC